MKDTDHFGLQQNLSQAQREYIANQALRLAQEAMTLINDLGEDLTEQDLAEFFEYVLTLEYVEHPLLK